MQVVRMLVGISGTRDGADWPPRGGTVALPDDEAAALVRAGMAEDAGSIAAVEVAAVEVGGGGVERAADVSKPRARRTGAA